MLQSIKNNWRPILFLLVITPFLTELLSTNLSLEAILHPLTFVALVVVGYGLPVLVIRELAVKWNVSFFGVLIMGLAYGIFNEGILAKTFLLADHVPITAFNNYIFFWGINFSWRPIITIWHALHAVLFPILLTHFFFPGCDSRSWLSPRGVWMFPIPAIVISTIGFFQKGTSGVIGTWPFFVLFWALIIGIIYIARIFKKGPEKIINCSPLKLTLTGFLFVLVFILAPSALASGKVPSLIFFGYLLVALLLFSYLLRDIQNNFRGLIFVALGTYIASATFGLIFNIANGRTPEIISELLFITVFIFLIRKNTISTSSN